MTQQEHNDLTRQILAAGNDQATLTSLLTRLSDDYNDQLGQIAQLNESNTNNTAEVERLRNANMELFLKIPSQNTPPIGAAGTPAADEPPSFDSLFNEKGLLK